MPIAGVYRASSEPTSPYWHAWNEAIYIRCPTYPECPTPPQFLIADAQAVSQLSRSSAFPP